MDKKLYVLLALFFPLFLSAQTNYKAGVIVDLKGDTIRGLINYLEWVQNPATIDFKYKVNSVPQHMGAKDIQYFSINGYEYYRRYTVNISLNSTDLDHLSAIPDTSVKTAAVFLKILQSGKNATLFSYADDLKLRFYIADDTEAKPEELKYLMYLNPENNGNVTTRTLYQGQLSLLAGNHHVDISGMLSGLKYDEHDLVRVVAKINGGENSLSIQNKQPSIRYFAGLAAGINTLTFKSNEPGLFGGSATSFSPQLSFGFKGYFNPNVGRSLILAQLSLSTASYTLDHITPNSLSGSVEPVTEHLKQYDPSLSVQFVFNFYNTTALKVFAGAGVRLNVPIYPVATYTYSFESATPASKPVMESIYFSFPIRAGVTINKSIDIYLAYLPPAVLESSYLGIDGKVTSFQAGIDYLFGK